MSSPKVELLETSAQDAPRGPRLDRRQFIVSATGGFMLEFCMSGVSRFGKAMAATTPTVTSKGVNSYIQINSDNTVNILFGGCELGQGAMSGLAQIAAEELMVEWSQVKTFTALPGKISYITGGSSAIRDNYLPVRTAGAAVRMMLIQAAANQWGVAVSSCAASNGHVVHTPTQRSLSYASLAAAAAKLKPPASPTFIPDANLRLIGQPVPRLDLPNKVNGKAKFGIDVRLPGTLYAAVKHAPSFGGTVASMPNSRNGVTYVNLGNAIAAVVAGTTWDAWQAAEEANVQWNIPASAADLNSTTFDTQAAAIMASGPFVQAELVGNPTVGQNTSSKFIEATYSFPYLAHACMEVLNCTVNLTDTMCEVFAPTQAAAWVQSTAAALTGLPLNKVAVHTTLLGGALGRKFELDYITQAVQVAMAIKKPVKLTWKREEDFANDMYRPMALCYVKGGTNSSNQITYWHNKIVTPSILAQRGWVSAGAEDGQATEGATELAYAMGSRLVEFGAHPSPIPIGFWRSVGLSFNAFVVESFIDEIANSLNLDPYQYRRTLLASQPRFLAVLDAAATLGGWTKPLSSGHSRGIAIAQTFGTIVAEVVEIANVTATSAKVVSVACAVDCGRVINPDSVKAQMEGGIVHGMGAALWGHITFTNGTASVRNFNNYRLVRGGEMPQVNVHIIPSTVAPTGTGEPGVPPFAPAFANAHFRATGTRVRTLPFFPTESHMSD
jgi:isoquinoline 1-oxidoreductase subunit beta